MSRAVIRSDSDSDSASAGLTADPADLADPAAAASAAVTAFGLVPDLVDDLPSLALLTSAALHSLDLRSSAYLLLVYLFYLPVSLFLNKTVLVFLTCLAVLRILYRPVEKQVRLRILM